MYIFIQLRYRFTFIFDKVIKNFDKTKGNGQNTYANIMKLHWLTRIV